MSALRNIRDRTHELIAAVTPSYLHLLPDLVSQNAASTDCGELSVVCRSLLLYRIGLLRRSFFRWSRINSGIAAQRTRVAFSCWMFQKTKPRLPLSSSLNICGILQPSCCSSVLTASAALLFSCKGSAPSLGSKWISGVVCFTRRCIIQHICERIVGWYSILSARRLAGHWRVIASQLELFRSLGRWRRRQKLLRFFRGWRVLCGQECKVRLHRCYFDSLSYHHIMRRVLTLWHLYVCKLSSAKNRLSVAVKARVLRRTFLAWKQLGPVVLFASHRYSDYVLKLKRAFFSRLLHWKSVSIHSQQLAERMRASVHVACTGRLMRSTFNSFFQFAASSRLSIKKKATYDVVALMSARHLVSKAFKGWSVWNKENRLLESQQVTACILVAYDSKLIYHSAQSELMSGECKILESCFVFFVDGMMLAAENSNQYSARVRSNRNSQNFLCHPYIESMQKLWPFSI